MKKIQILLLLAAFTYPTQSFAVFGLLRSLCGGVSGGFSLKRKSTELMITTEAALPPLSIERAEPTLSGFEAKVSLKDSPTDYAECRYQFDAKQGTLHIYKLKGNGRYESEILTYILAAAMRKHPLATGVKIKTSQTSTDAAVIKDTDTYSLFARFGFTEFIPEKTGFLNKGGDGTSTPTWYLHLELPSS